MPPGSPTGPTGIRAGASCADPDDLMRLSAAARRCLGRGGRVFGFDSRRPDRNRLQLEAQQLARDEAETLRRVLDHAARSLGVSAEQYTLMGHVILYSVGQGEEAAGRRSAAQAWHCDWSEAETQRLRSEGAPVPMSLLVTLDPCGRLLTPGGSGARMAAAGDAVLFEGDFVHAGAAYADDHARAFAYVCPDVPEPLAHPENLTYDEGPKVRAAVASEREPGPEQGQRRRKRGRDQDDDHDDTDDGLC